MECYKSLSMWYVFIRKHTEVYEPMLLKGKERGKERKKVESFEQWNNMIKFVFSWEV